MLFAKHRPVLVLQERLTRVVFAFKLPPKKRQHRRYYQELVPILATGDALLRHL